MQNNHSGYELDIPFTPRELLLSLGYAVLGVTAAALIVNLWLLPVKMI